MAKRDDRADMATVIDMARKSRKNGIKRGQGPAIRVAQEPLAWACWDTPDRVAVRPDIRNETGEKLARLLVMSFADGALKIAATRRPHTLIHAAAGAARLRHTWVKSVLVSEPRQGVERACETLSKRLGLAGCRNVGGRLFEATPVEAAAAILRDLYPDMQALPPEPVEHVIPMFLRKENPMSVTATPPIPQPAGDGLIPVFQGVIGGVACNVCDARTLHAFLEVGKDFTNWIKDRIAKYQFVENQDFAVCSPNSASKGTEMFTNSASKRGGHNRMDYHLTLDMAKELSMVENNEKGRQARRYFIECERRALEALGVTRAGDQGGLPEICEEACDARAWFIFNRARESTLCLLGSAAREGDDERLLDGMFWVKTRIQERLREQARRQLAGRRDPQAVAAWILAWTPDRPALA